MADTAIPAAESTGTEIVAGAGSSDAAPRRYVSTTQAAFIGVGAMVGAGIFSLLGAAGAVAGAAVWISFVLAGIIAALQGYSFAKLVPSFRRPVGCSSTSTRASASATWRLSALGSATASTPSSRRWLPSLLAAMPARCSPNSDPNWVKIFAVLVVVATTLLNIVGSTIVARVQSLIVFVVVGILALFAVVTIANINPSYLAPATYPSVQNILSSVALTFFAFLGFGVVTFTAKDLAEPSRQLPRAITIAIGIAAVIYIAVAVVCSAR